MSDTFKRPWSQKLQYRSPVRSRSPGKVREQRPRLSFVLFCMPYLSLMDLEKGQGEEKKQEKENKAC